MLKFSRYFFIVFLLVTVLPLTLMFFWNHHQVGQIREAREQKFLDFGIKQLEYNTNRYLNSTEDFISRVVVNLATENVTLKQIKNIIGSDYVYLIGINNELYGDNPVPEVLKKIDFGKIKSKRAYYDLLSSGGKAQPAAVFVIPYKIGENKGIVVLSEVDLKMLRPSGPFVAEVYNAYDKSLIGIVRDPYGPPLKRWKNPPNHPPDANVQSSSLSLKNFDGNDSVSVIIKNFSPPRPPHPPRKSPEEAGVEFGLIFLLTGAVLSLLTGFYIKKNFINPFVAISDASERIQKGDLSFQLDAKTSSHEVRNTFLSFNQMIEGLKEKEEIRNSFISSLTHDLRTPLIAQERALEMISDEFEKLNLSEPYKLAKSLAKNNKHLLVMVNLILETYRFDEKNIKPVIAPLDLREIVRQSFEQLSSLASDKQVKFENLVPADFPKINADAHFLKRVLLNLMSNALDNTGNNGRIAVSSEIKDNKVFITVEDNGLGISDKEINYLFDKYYTGKSDERKLGSGLGLYVCKKLIEMHNGNITVESKENEFTRFTVTFPSELKINGVE